MTKADCGFGAPHSVIIDIPNIFLHAPERNLEEVLYTLSCILNDRLRKMALTCSSIPGMPNVGTKNRLVQCAGRVVVSWAAKRRGIAATRVSDAIARIALRLMNRSTRHVAPPIRPCPREAAGRAAVDRRCQDAIH